MEITFTFESNFFPLSAFLRSKPVQSLGARHKENLTIVFIDLWYSGLAVRNKTYFSCMWECFFQDCRVIFAIKFCFPEDSQWTKYHASSKRWNAIPGYIWVLVALDVFHSDKQRVDGALFTRNAMDHKSINST